MFIAVAGLPGVGKTRVIEKLHELDNGSIVVNEDLKFEESEEFRKFSKDLNIKAHYYYDLSKIIYLSKKIKKINYRNHNVYVDGYYIQKVAFYRAAGLDVELDYEKNGILKPDITIMVVENTNINENEDVNIKKNLVSLMKRGEKLTFYRSNIESNYKILFEEIKKKEEKYRRINRN